MKINNMVQQAQTLQAQMAQRQEKLADARVAGTAGGGMVKAVFSGHGDLIEIQIDPEVIRAEEAEMLEDLVTVAVNDGLRKSRELAGERMGAITGALGSLGLGF
jgi:DNA-binding YbaB/EbfC family protein